MSTKNTLHIIASELAQALRPLKDAIASPANFNSFLRELGWNAAVTSVPSDFANLANDINQLIIKLQAIGSSPTLPDIQDLISKAKMLYTSIKNIPNTSLPSSVSSSFYLDASQRIFEYLLLRYINTEFPLIYNVLTSSNAITIQYNAASGTRPFFNEVKFDPDKLVDLISQPSTIPAIVYGWGTSSFRADKVLANLFELFTSIGFSPNMRDLPYRYLLNYGITQTYERSKQQVLCVPLLNFIAGGSQKIGVEITGFYGDERTPDTGIIIQPYLPNSFGTTIDLGENFEINLRSATNLFELFAIVIAADNIDIRFPGQPNTTLPEAGFGATLSYTPDEVLTLLGNPLGSRLEMRGADLSFNVDYLEDSFEIELDAALKGFAIVLKGGDGDGFISKILGNVEKRIEVELGVNWSNTGGLRFRGAGGFELQLNPHIQLGPITIDNLRLAVQAPPTTPAKVKVIAAAGVKLELGPFTAIVQEIGVELALTFAEGNAGPFDIKAGFKPPTGLGLKMESGTVTGGGFLSFNKDEGRYVGALELSVKDKIAIKAIGILTTKLPSGQPGYSLLLLITAEFQPIQLGFGFTLNGVGGIIALHRRMNTEGLRDGVRNGTIDNILFPTNPVENIDNIISSLETVFPIQEGRYSFGPMAIIGWGTPTLITAELGLFFELPGANEFALIGVIRALLPNKDKPILKLQIAFAGIINFEKKTIIFDATLFDSSVAGMGLSGDMVFRLVWGDKPTFVLSVGGFHPKFPIPPLNIPNMRRLTINLIDGEKPRLTLSTYFAITSNTAQFGAAIDFLWAINDNIDLRGHLGFDALFYFSPFRFEASIDGSLEVRRRNKAIMSISFAGLLEGPTPWHVQGNVSFKVLGVEFDKDFDKTFGDHDTTTLPDVKVLDKLIVALEDKKNWQATVSDDVPLLVTIREFNTSGPEVVVHPQGKLAVSQKIVPLDIDITRFGNCRPDPTGYSYFSLNISYDASTANILQKDPLKEYFAPNEFFNLSETDRLNSASFQKLTSGLEVKSTSTALKGGKPRRRKYNYEQIIMDSRRTPVRMTSPSTIAVAFRATSTTGTTAANSNLGSASTDRLRASDAPLPITETAASFAIAKTSDLTSYNSLIAGSRIEAQKILEQQLLLNPALEGQLQIVNQFEVAV
ncbi:hypothetical protein CNR22_18345 [Sphingobacteriaceae bacterium]|nr:hypothetical protein CNR22_18345 [Sphingobacteriaceae bacterium]